MARPYRRRVHHLLRGLQRRREQDRLERAGLGSEGRVRETLRQYARYFVGPTYAEPFAGGLLRRWRRTGEVRWRLTSASTRRWQKFQAMERDCRAARPAELAVPAGAVPRLLRRLRPASAAAGTGAPEVQATSVLAQRRRARLDGGDERGRARCWRGRAQPVAADLRARVFQLAEALFQSIRMQLAVPLYRAIAVGRGANLDSDRRAAERPRRGCPSSSPRSARCRASGSGWSRLDRICALDRSGPWRVLRRPRRPDAQPHLVRGPGLPPIPARIDSGLTGFGSLPTGGCPG